MPAEMIRLLNKSLLVASTGLGLLPGISAEDMSTSHDVLDVACGPGGWVLEYARQAPHATIVGVDSSLAMITYARTLARAQGLSNVHFVNVPQFCGPFHFRRASFDIISAQFLSKTLVPSQWTGLLAECRRLLRTGGNLRLTECEVATTNSPAVEELSTLFLRAMMQARQSFAPTERHLGVLCELEPMVTGAGFREVKLLSHVVNYSYGAPFSSEWKMDYLLGSKSIQALIVATGIATQEHVDHLHTQQVQEMSFPSFHALLHLLTLTAKR